MKIKFVMSNGVVVVRLMIESYFEMLLENVVDKLES